MHCVSGYPTPDHEANIGFIHKLKIKYPKIPIGLSDHTNNIYSSLASVSLGIVAIEKHFIKSKKSLLLPLWLPEISATIIGGFELLNKVKLSFFNFIF